MISPEFTTIVIITFMIVFGVVMPILKGRKDKKGSRVSYRWSVVVVLLAVLLGCVMNFGHLSDDTRRATIISIMIIVGLFMLIRTLEKILENGWTLGVRKATIKKGDIEGKVEFETSKDISKEDQENGE